MPFEVSVQTTISDGSEGLSNTSLDDIVLQYSTNSDGSEGCSYIHCFCHMLQYSKVSHGSEGFNKKIK